MFSFTSCSRNRPKPSPSGREILKHGLKVDYLGFGLVGDRAGVASGGSGQGPGRRLALIEFHPDLLHPRLRRHRGIVHLGIHHPQPDRRSCRCTRNSTSHSTNLIMFAVGFILFGTTQLLPQYTQTLLGYNATWAGLVISPGGFAVMAMMPMVGYLVTHYQPKWLIVLGMFIEGCSLFYMTRFDTQTSSGRWPGHGFFRRRGWRFFLCRSIPPLISISRRAKPIMRRL